MNELERQTPIGHVCATDLAFYENVFRGMLWGDSPEFIVNDSVDHAIVLTRCLIESAHKTVKVFCRALSSDVWNNDQIVNAVAEALASNVSFKVSVCDAPMDSGTSRLLKENDSSEIRMFPYKDVCSNFLLVDDKAFRFEPNCAERKGFAVARAPEESKILTQTFDRIWSLSQQIPPDFSNEK